MEKVSLKPISPPSKLYWKRLFYWCTQYISNKGLFSLCALGMNSLSEWLRFRFHRNSSINLMNLDIIEKNLQNKTQATCYAPTPIIPFANMIKSLTLPDKPVFVDYGAGKARAMLLAGETKRFHKIKGLEFSAALCESGRQNIQSYLKQGHPDCFQLIHKDVVQYHVQPEDNVFYFFHPFNENILKICLTNIFSSLKSHPRKALLIYHSNYKDYTKNIVQGEFFQLLKTFSALGSYFYVYKHDSIH